MDEPPPKISNFSNEVYSMFGMFAFTVKQYKMIAPIRSNIKYLFVFLACFQHQVIGVTK